MTDHGAGGALAGGAGNGDERNGQNAQGESDLGSELWGEMFEPLKDKSRFADFVLHNELETLVWPNGADFATEFLYQKLCPDYRLKPQLESGVSR